MKRIEIMSVGVHHAENGKVYTVSPQMLKEIHESYDAEIYEAPLVIGHPKSDLPAFGWVKSLELEGEILFANIDETRAEIEQSVRDGLYRNISAAFYPPEASGNPTPEKWHLRHIGLLGAQPPAVKGLAKVEFAEGDEFESFSTENSGEVSRLESELLAERNARLELEKRLAALTASDARKSAEEFVDEVLIKTGKVLPRNRENAVLLVLLLGSVDEERVEFSESENPLELFRATFEEGKSYRYNRGKYSEKNEKKMPAGFIDPTGH